MKKKKIKFLTAILLLTLLPQISLAIAPSDSMIEIPPAPPEAKEVDIVTPLEPASAYRQIISVPKINIKVPTVVELPLSYWVSPGENFLVHEIESDTYLDSYFNYESNVLESSFSAATSPGVRNSSRMVDGNRNTYVDFQVPEEGYGEVVITLRSNEPITTDRFDLKLGQYVSLPNTIEIKYEPVDQPGVVREVVSRTSLRSGVVNFPEIVSSNFEVTLSYVQLLRIAEINFNDKSADLEESQALRFLAQPNKTYEVYFDSDRSVNVAKKESGDLFSDEGVVTLPGVLPKENYFYIPADVDGDGVEDLLDNCVRNQNSDQEDFDENGRGDVCDDWDRDGRINSQDNCVNDPNRSQRDVDGDGIGDICDEEESRFTEANPWVPWVGMGGAAFVLLILFVMVAKAPKPETFSESEIPESGNQE